MAEEVIVNTEPIDRLLEQIEQLEEMDFSPLMEDWRVILKRDNEENLGIDGFGIPMVPVTYRPDPNVGKRKPINYEHIPPYDNLHSSHYRTLGGPPLSPRGSDSRVTQFFRTSWERDEPEEGDWVTMGMWEDFKSIEGLEILPIHAGKDQWGTETTSDLPIRDLLHIRPSALSKAYDALVSFLNALLRRI
jgi:hypothetical protein